MFMVLESLVKFKSNSKIIDLSSAFKSEGEAK